MSQIARTLVLWSVITTSFVGHALRAEKPGDTSNGHDDAAKAAQNPLASAVSVPLQDNVSFNLGSPKRVSNVLNIQPVFPVPVKKVLLINRLILPLAYQPDSAVDANGNPDFAEEGGEFGLGDLNLSIFLAPSKQGKIIFGGGPIFNIPTATVDALKSKKFGIGPAAVFVAMPGKVVLGFIVQNIWSVAGASDGRDINNMLIQYFINVNLPYGIYIATSPLITANWEVPNENRWTVPVGGGMGKIVKLGKFPLNLQVNGYYNVVRPELGPEWSMRFQLQFFLPSPFGKKSHEKKP